jgi:hypothetical protein
MIPVATPPQRPASSSVQDVRVPEPGAVLTEVDGEEPLLPGRRTRRWERPSLWGSLSP